MRRGQEGHGGRGKEIFSIPQNVTSETRSFLGLRFADYGPKKDGKTSAPSGCLAFIAECSAMQLERDLIEQLCPRVVGRLITARVNQQRARHMSHVRGVLFNPYIMHTPGGSSCTAVVVNSGFIYLLLFKSQGSLPHVWWKRGRGEKGTPSPADGDEEAITSPRPPQPSHIALGLAALGNHGYNGGMGLGPRGPPKNNLLIPPRRG